MLKNTTALADSFERVGFDTADGGQVEAAFFPASDSKVVIFAHGAIFNKESWYFLAQAFRERGISSLAIDFRGYGNSTPGSSSKKMYDVLAAITYVKDQGFGDISLVGGSMGGAAVLAALDNNTIPVSKVVLLAPAGGPAIRSDSTNKLFVVAEEEGLFKRVMGIYTASAEPKAIKVYPGDSHAQHLFKTGVREDLVARIINFITNGESE